jgi:putative membrane protein
MTTQPRQPDEPAFGDATRRSYLAAERTLLAWWRSGLAALAVALGVGRLVPALIDAPTAPFIALGVGFGVLALAFIVYGVNRQRHVERAMAEGSFRQLDSRVITSMATLMVVLVTATVVLIVFER